MQISSWLTFGKRYVIKKHALTKLDHTGNRDAGDNICLFPRIDNRTYRLQLDARDIDTLKDAIADYDARMERLAIRAKLETT